MLVVIPTYNEAAHLEELLLRVEALGPNIWTLVVDDGSTDGTLEIATRRSELARLDGTVRMNLISRKAKMGLGRAYVAGFSWGLERDFSRFVEMDADLSHDPGQLLSLIEATDSVDLAIGSRYVPGGSIVGWSWVRHLLSKMGNAYARAMLGLPVRDSTSGFRCYRREVLESIGLESVRSEGYAFQVEMAYRAWRAGHSIREVPIVFRERSSGNSKMSKAIVFEAMWSVTRWGASRLRRGSAR